MGRSSACKDSVTPHPLAPVTHQPQYSGDRRRHGSKERVYGKTSRRKEIAKLRGIVINAGHRECKSFPDHKKITLHDGLVKQAAKHHIYTPDSSRSLIPRIPPERQIMSMLRHGVGAVGSTFLPWKHARRAIEAEKSDGLPFEEARASNTTTLTPSSQQDIDNNIGSDVTKIRRYIDLLDEYSLHHFLIWQGKVVRDTPEFSSLARTRPMWSSIERYVTILEKIMAMNAVPLAIIDGKKLADLARFDLEGLDGADLCGCIENLEQIHPLLHRTNLTNSDLSFQQRAAVKIQALARRFLKRSDFLTLSHERSAAVKLQCFVRYTRSRRLVLELLAVHRKKAKSKWQEMHASLRANWARWGQRERVLVFLQANADYSAHDLLASRAPWIVDPMVHVVYIVPSLPDPGIWHLVDVQLLARARILETLRRYLHRAINIRRPDKYETWTHFLGHMGRAGGVIEAEAPDIVSHPSASVFVSPSGKIISLTEGEMLYDAGNERVGCVYPQECVPPNALRGATTEISRELYLRGVVGYVSIHFVMFWDREADSLRLWATELELGLNTLSFGFSLFRLFTSRAKRVQDLGWFENPSSQGREGRSLQYVYLDHVRHPNLQSARLSTFFKLCRMESISFDLATKVGTIFDFRGNLACGLVGLLVISHSKKEAVERAMNTLKFIEHLARQRDSCRVGTLSKEMRVLRRELKRLQALNHASLPIENVKN